MKKQDQENYLSVLTKLKKTIIEGNIDGFKKVSNSIDSKSNGENQLILRDCYDDAKNPIRSTNLVILSSKHIQVKILDYLFGRDSRILNNLSVVIKRNPILPKDEDEEQHNAFYYAMRSSNIELLDTLINKWPKNYFTVHPEELDEILSRAYEELKLKNVLLSDEMEIFVENRLINLRFFSNSSGKVQNCRTDLNSIRGRMELILQNINLLTADYSNTDKVDERFLFVAKFIAQNIHILKRQLKSSYARLPWEEIEFCLIIFVSCYAKRQDVNIFYRATLNKGKLLNHLDNFAKKLEDEKDIIKGANVDKLADIPPLKRDKVVAKIISSYPPFEELYNDYQEIRDIHSMERLNTYINLAISADPKEREGQLIITRVLQAMGEYFKNTLESPKLSNTTSQLFLLSLPRNARDIIVDLRNSLSHAYSLSKRIEIEETKDVNFFLNIQNDTKKIGDVITDLLYKNKMKTIRILLKKIIDSENANEIKAVTELLSSPQPDEKMVSQNVKMMEHEKLEELVKKLSHIITDKTNYEMELFKKINGIISSASTVTEATRTDYILGVLSLQSLGGALKENKIDQNVIRGIKFRANLTLQNISPKMEPHSFKEIANLSDQITDSVQSRLQEEKLDKVIRLNFEIFYIIQLGTNDVKWIEELREKLLRDIPKHKEKMPCSVTAEKHNNQLTLKVTELKSILSKNSLSDPITCPNLASYKNDKNLKAVVEMLVLDIMSILGSSMHCLEDNLLFLDENTPLLTGKCLRNHLAHDNVLLNVLLSDPSVAVILNASKLVETNLVRNKKMIGKLVTNDSLKLKAKFDHGVVTIMNQERMFLALEEGNLAIFKDCLKSGADINARSINSWTTLHFAAKGSNLKLVKFIIDHHVSANATDIDGQTPLHVAAANGMQNIVEFFVTEAGLYVDEVNDAGKTPLHFAAQNGHRDVVEVLLRNKASNSVQTISGLSPLHCAIRNNHVDVVKLLLTRDVNVDINETKGGFTALHEAAEHGYLELVNFLLDNGADVHARTDHNWIPLHAAAFNGHPEVVNSLITKGSNVNARIINGCTPLHYAVETGREGITNILLKHGANVNPVDKTYHNTPLHYAAKDGHYGIVKTLLKNNADANVITVAGSTPLHFAIGNNHLEIATALLKHGVNVHAIDKNFGTPLHYAAGSGHKEAAALLIEHGVQINATANDNLTPLHVATRNSHKDVVDLLIKNEADINTPDIQGSTPLHAAAINGSTDIIDLLITNKVEVDTRTYDGITPLHAAALSGHSNVIDLLLKNKADINAISDIGLTPLHCAVREGCKDIVNLLINHKAHIEGNSTAVTPLQIATEAGHKDIVEILIANGANLNVKINDMTPLLSAVKNNNKDIVKVLISNGTNDDEQCNEAIFPAVLSGFTDIVEILLKAQANINIRGPENVTPLHFAAKRGHKKIVNALLSHGADVHSVTTNNVTPLCLAAQGGYADILEMLIEAGAEVNVKCDEDFTPLHSASSLGYTNVVKVLLDNKAKLNVKDKKKRTPVELAVVRGHFQVVKMLLQSKKVDINAKGNDDFTLLHIASQESNVEIVKYLVEEGSDINARNASGSKSIHIAARDGLKDAVEFFLSKGMSINDTGAANQTLLHYAALKGDLVIAKYLIEQGADVNVKDSNGSTPVHIAATCGSKDVIEVLLRSGAVYNAIDNFRRKPLEVASNKHVKNLLEFTDKLFEAVKCNSISEVKNYIKAGAFLNAKNSENVTPLHYAVWKGFDTVVNILLENEANPNAVGNKRITPLHYAAKFCHLKIVIALLSKSAVYDAVSDGGKTPSDCTEDESITSLFKRVSESFRKVKIGNSQVIHDLNKIKDIDTVKAIMGARNKENKSLIVAAMQSNFPLVEQLKAISQGDVTAQIDLASVLLDQNNYQEALSMFRKVFEKRKEILGLDNPGTLDIQTHIGKALYKMGRYHEALTTFQEILQKRKEMLDVNDKDTLSIRSIIALVMYRQDENKEALNIYEEVYPKQKKLLGAKHSDTLDTQFHMALVLHKLGKFEEALNMNKAVLQIRKAMFGANHGIAIRAQNNIAMVLASQGNYEDALKMYQEVLKKKRISLGINHADTLRTSQHIAGVFLQQKKYFEALQAYQEILNIQKSVLGANHPETLTTQYSIGEVLFTQGKWIGALQAYRQCLNQITAIFGPTNPKVLTIYQRLEAIKMILKLKDTSLSEVLEHLQKDITIAASNGDLQTVQRLLKDGADANDKDVDGRTPLHYAISNGRIAIVNILLKNGADVTQFTNKGNTPLHTAASQGNNKIVEILLQHVSRDKLMDFINYKTIASGTTALHVAAKNGLLDVTMSILRRGAIYNIENNEGKTPLHLCKEDNISSLLKLIEESFEDTRNGNAEMIIKLQAVKPHEFVAVTNARNNQGNTLLQVAITNGSKNIVRKMLELLKNQEENLEDVDIESGVKSLRL